jgi:dolichyl-phosphate beta-glucosyltransferase
VIVVSDGSTDATEQVARDAFAQAPDASKVECRFIGYRPNAGKGVAVRTGVLATRGRYVAFADADLSTPIEEVDRALAYLQGSGMSGGSPAAGQPRAGADRIVIGSRAAAGADVARQQPLYRRLAARGFNYVRDFVVGIRGLHDTQCGLKVFEGDLARAIFARQRIPGFMFDPETVLIAQRLGVPIYEMGVRWTDSPDTRVRLSSGLRLLPDLLRIRLLHGRLTPADLPAMLESGPQQAAKRGATR